MLYENVWLNMESHDKVHRVVGLKSTESSENARSVHRSLSIQLSSHKLILDRITSSSKTKVPSCSTKMLAGSPPQDLSSQT